MQRLQAFLGKTLINDITCITLILVSCTPKRMCIKIVITNGRNPFGREFKPS